MYFGTGTSGTDALRERLDQLEEGDRAMSRTNPLAVVASTNTLVTADHVNVAQQLYSGAVFLCPKCSGAMRFHVNGRGTAYFAHAAAKGSCSPGIETPAHLCIKRGLHSIGFECEHRDAESGYRFDAYHRESDTAAEVVTTGVGRYMAKIEAMRRLGRKCLWIMDSGSRSLASREGTELVRLATFEASGTVVLEGLFNAKAQQLISAIDEQSLYAFYLGLAWKCVGGDAWQLLDADQPLSKAATADDGMKHLMVKMHLQNADTVVENKRRGIDRKTWFDRTFKYRGKFNISWSGDRDYVVDLVSQIIRDAEKARSLPRRGGSPRSSPSLPVHASVDDVIKKLDARHSVSLEEARALRSIAEQSKATCYVEPSSISASSNLPMVFGRDEITAVRQHVEIRSSRVGSRAADHGKDCSARVRQANELFDYASRSPSSPSVCRGGEKHAWKPRLVWGTVYDVCDVCGASRCLGRQKPSSRLVVSRTRRT